MDGTSQASYARNLSFTESQLVQFVKTVVLVLKLQGKKESTRIWKYVSVEHKANE